MILLCISTTHLKHLHEYGPINNIMSLLYCVFKSIRTNSPEQFYTQLYSYINKLILK